MHTDKFINYLRNERNFSEKTVNSYYTDLNQFLLFVKKNISSVHNTDLREWIVNLKNLQFECLDERIQLIEDATEAVKKLNAEADKTPSFIIKIL